jgi:quinol monooxygenase YgiN
MAAAEPGNKFIVGWIKLRKGTEDEFDRLVTPYLEACRAEPECRFFEMTRKREDSNVVLVCECFISEAAHDVHLRRQHVVDFFKVLNRIALVGDFENIVAEFVEPDTLDFSLG